MPTLTVYRTRILNRVGAHTGDSFYTNARIDEAVNLALHQVTTEKDWPWLQTSTTITTVAGTAGYALPADYLRTDSISRAATGNQLDRRSKKELNRFIGSGEPLLYTTYGGNVVLKPTPDGVYTLTHDYYRIENTLTNGADVSLIPDPYAEGVVEYAAFLLYRGRREPDKSSEALASYALWLRRTEDTLKMSREPLRITVRAGSEF